MLLEAVSCFFECSTCLLTCTLFFKVASLTFDCTAGNGFYWRIAAKDEDASILEIRRAEDGVRTWAAKHGEHYHMLDGGKYGGLWRRNDRPPQQLVGVGFTAQGDFTRMPYKRVCFDPEMDWLFQGIEGDTMLVITLAMAQLALN